MVVQSGTPVAMPWKDEVAAIVQSWYGGNETGNAIADVLFGDVNPSGKLSLTWPKRLQDHPAFINARSDMGRVLYGEDIFVGYRWYEKLQHEVLWPFGHGLSYTHFELSDARLEEQGEDDLIVSVKVQNTGTYAGAEVVQAYVQQENPKSTRPTKELKGFDKVSVRAGHTETATIRLSRKYAASTWDERDGSWVMEKDRYRILLGTSSADCRLDIQFEVARTIYWKGL